MTIDLANQRHVPLQSDVDEPSKSPYRPAGHDAQAIEPLNRYCPAAHVLALAVGEGEGDSETEGDSVTDGDGDGDAVVVTDGEFVTVKEGVGVAVAVLVLVLVAVGQSPSVLAVYPEVGVSDKKQFTSKLAMPVLPAIAVT